MPKALPVIDTTAPICCSPVAAAPMSDDDALEVARAAEGPRRPGAGPADESAAGSQDEVCTCDLAPAVGLTEATVSFHLGKLRGAGLVDRRAARHERLLPRASAPPSARCAA